MVVILGSVYCRIAMATSAIVLLLSIQAATAPVSGGTHTPPSRPGMVYNDITGHYVPIVGWRPQARAGTYSRGTKLERRKIGEKIGEAPLGH
jgi:hypothetical protein